jgi:hypothetical protein
MSERSFLDLSFRALSEFRAAERRQERNPEDVSQTMLVRGISSMILVFTFIGSAFDAEMFAHGFPRKYLESAFQPVAFSGSLSRAHRKKRLALARDDRLKSKEYSLKLPDDAFRSPADISIISPWRPWSCGIVIQTFRPLIHPAWPRLVPLVAAGSQG